MPDTETIIINLFNLVYTTIAFLISLWWIYIPLILFFFARDIWYKYIREKRKQKLEWILLELIPPREIQKTPQAMEHFFSTLHGTAGGANFKDRNWEGILPDYFSFETVGQGGETHFIIRTLKKYRDLVEAAIYAQYPDSEITQVDDYTNMIPADPLKSGYTVWGTEYIFAKEDAYPIKTYPDFDRDTTPDEKRCDPMASLLEIINRLTGGEKVWIQILARPVADKWKSECEGIKSKLLGREEKKGPGVIAKELGEWKEATFGVAHSIATGELSQPERKEEQKKRMELNWMSKGEAETVKSVEDKASKLGYESVIRLVYLAPQEEARKGAVKKSIMGAFKQFGTQNLNSFKPNPQVTTDALDYEIELRQIRDPYRQRKVLLDYQNREFPAISRVHDYLKKPLIFERLPVFRWFYVRSKPIILNTEELASIYHFPAITVKAPLVPKVEAKKAEPPRGLPTEDLPSE